MKVGLIGSGFMGQAHVFGYATAQRVFDMPITFEMDTMADENLEKAEKARRAFGFSRATGNWRDLIDDPYIDLIDITAPNALHKEIAMAAIAAGKHVYCEKPLAPLAKDALEMAEAAEEAGMKTQVGFNYLMNPMFSLAREMITSGELGEIYSYRGLHAEDYMADPNGQYTFRHDPAGGGALADIGSHALATAEFLLGPIIRIMGHSRTIIPKRKDFSGHIRDITVDDLTHCFAEFSNGVTGSIEANWCATGRKMQHDFEVYGSNGSLHFSQERFNELHYFNQSDAAGLRGFRRIEASPDHPPYGNFCVAPGHQIGFNDLKAIEINGFANAISGASGEPFNFRAGWRIQSLVETIQRSAKENRWIDTEPAA
ncbi:MAG: 1-carboxy-3-chloro-3,4-dihydroxycyclo hexa-1,5-diene dehydrogenase [Aestuariivita sp.]|nr:1-carboxy-3-chloro-3,4-dihydroxycyclo hexa-1,5-diene dehydrogenase [Aestuariivita sp.]